MVIKTASRFDYKEEDSLRSYQNEESKLASDDDDETNEFKAQSNMQSTAQNHYSNRDTSALDTTPDGKRNNSLAFYNSNSTQ